MKELENDIWDDNEFVKELDRRTEELETGKVKGYSWDEVKEMTRKALEDQKKEFAGTLFMPSIKTTIMKTSRKEESHQSKQGHVNTPRPEIRDTLDSRKEKEAGYKEHESKAPKKGKK